MNDEIFRLMELSSQGFCCSQAIVQMGLDSLGKNDSDLIRTVGGLCGGLRSGKGPCGAFTGAICFISLFLGKGSAEETEHEELKTTIAAFSEWFESEYASRYGGADCLSILEGDPGNRASRCPSLVLACYAKARVLTDAVLASSAGEKAD